MQDSDGHLQVLTIELSNYKIGQLKLTPVEALEPEQVLEPEAVSIDPDAEATEPVVQTASRTFQADRTTRQTALSHSSDFTVNGGSSASGWCRRLFLLVFFNTSAPKIVNSFQKPPEKT